MTIRGADTTFLLSDGKLSQLNENQEAERWDCLFLTLTEFDHVLAYAKGLARYPFT